MAPATTATLPLKMAAIDGRVRLIAAIVLRVPRLSRVAPSLATRVSASPMSLSRGDLPSGMQMGHGDRTDDCGFHSHEYRFASIASRLTSGAAEMILPRWRYACQQRQYRLLHRRCHFAARAGRAGVIFGEVAPYFLISSFVCALS